MTKKILYIANIRLPTEKAHGVQIMEMCAAFSSQGVEVELVVPRRNNPITEETFSFYDMPKNFRITRLWTWDLVQFGPIGFLIQSFTFTLAALWYTRTSGAWFYSRDDLFLFLISFTKKRYMYEVHAPKWHVVVRRALAHATLIVLISNGLKDFYIKKGISPAHMFVAPDGVNVERFTIALSREECRTKLRLPIDKKIALYSGHLYARKGAHTFAEAAKLLGDDILCVFVGGTEVDIAAFKKRYGEVKNVLILGHRPHQEIPYFLHAADVLVLPNSANNEDSRLYTSPMKLFEYMASGTPIVASDVPSLREILDEKTATLVSPDDKNSLTKGIMDMLSRASNYDTVTQNAQCRGREYSWNERVADILRQIDLNP